ncbi:MULTISPECIES: histidine kinase dimerization/phosphoacceptor domain -containing protein [unclassified Lacinutrix]
MKFSIKLFYICILICSLSYGQDAKPDAYQDSLQSVINKSTNKKEKTEVLFLMGEHLVQRNPQLAEKIANQLKQEYVNTADSSQVRRNNYIFAACHRWHGDYATALNYYQNIYNYSKKHKDSLDIAISGHFIGTLNMYLGNNVVSQKHLIETAKIYDAIGTAEQKARINNSLAGFYMNIDQLEKSKEQYVKALQQFEVLKDSSGMAGTNANLGLLYTELGNFDKAELHLMKQKELNKVFPTLREMGFHYDFLGLLRQKQDRLEEAYMEHLKALKIREHLSSTYNLCESKLNMGKVLIKLNRYPEAISHLKDVFKYDEHESLYQQQTAYQLLSEAYENSGNYKDALKDYKSFKEISDSIYSKESIEIIAEKDALYEKQNQDAEILLLNKEKEVATVKLSRTRAISIGTLIVLFLLSIAVLSLFKVYNKIKTKNQIITKALKDRELLLHETHHRVKNNLQMISSLLNLQSKYVEDEKAFEVLQNGRNRVQSMAILHKNLYAGDDLTLVNIQDYFEGLATSIFNSYQKSGKEIQVTIQAKGIVMEIESVVPIGLIVNELMTNSLKHAFEGVKSKNPEIIIVMKESTASYDLSVKDNGIGLREDFIKKSNTETFGQRLINSFVQKLKATITTNNNNGTEVALTIPKKLA